MQFKHLYKVLLVTCIQYGNKTEVKGVRGPLIDKHFKSYLYDLNTHIYIHNISLTVSKFICVSEDNL